MTFFWILIPFLLTMLLMPIGIKVLTHFEIMDIPDSRKVHKTPIPSTGGIIFFITFFFSILVFFYFDANTSFYHFDKNIISYFIGVIFLVLIGVIDDVRPLSANFKFIAQIFSAFIYVSNSDIYLQLPIISQYPIFSFILVIGFIVGVTNALNLIDGLDGLASGLSIISFATLTFFVDGYYIFIAIVTISVIFGFLRSNTFPAMIFMGDSGSYFLGYTLAILSIQTVVYSNIPIWLPLIIVGMPIIDTLLVFTKRALLKKNIFKPDKNHLHHQIQNEGISHKNTVFLLYSIQILFAFISIGLYVQHSVYFWVTLSIVLILTFQHILLIFKNDLKRVKYFDYSLISKLYKKLPIFKYLYVWYFTIILLILSVIEITTVRVLSSNISSDLNTFIILLSIVISFLFIADYQKRRSSNVSIGMIILSGITIFYSEGFIHNTSDNIFWYLLVIGIIASSIGMYKDRYYFDSPTEYLLICVMLIFSLFPKEIGSNYTPIAYTSFHLLILFLVYKILLQNKFIRKYNVIYVINILTLCIMIIIDKLN